MSGSLQEHLSGTIGYLSRKRISLEIELHDVTQILRSLQKELDSLTTNTAQLELPVDKPEGIYADISVRWAVFLFLTEYARGPETLGVIADALREGGSPSKAQSFNSNVSAVLSQMANKGEIEKNGDRFELTSKGRAVWYGISKSEKFINRNRDTKENTEGVA
jgi:hypothetical protein